MPALALCFQVHQPYHLLPLSFFDGESASQYFDVGHTSDMCRRVTRQRYMPANASLLRVLEMYGDSFSCAFSLTATALTQMREHAPEALESFKQIARFPSVDFLGATSHHSLAAMHSDAGEFVEQVRLHRDLITAEFSRTPRVFGNTELLCNERSARAVQSLGFEGMLIAKSGDLFADKSGCEVYRVASSHLSFLPHDTAASNDIVGARSHDSSCAQPLSAREYMERLSSRATGEDVVLVYVDYQTFGECHHASNSACLFLEELPEVVLNTPGWRFVTPTRIFKEYEPLADLELSRVNEDIHDCGLFDNQMQVKAFHELYCSDVRERLDLETWRRLQTSDHLYHMATREHADGLAKGYRNPFSSPYDAFISFMNVLRAVRSKA